MTTALQSSTAVAAEWDHPALRRLVSAIREAYGPRIERIVLFGSRARGEVEDDSDYDIAVFIHDIADRMIEIRRLRDIEEAAIGIGEQVFELIPFEARAWKNRTLFMRDVREEGIDL